jgi:DNA-binding response OmpR family regulator
LARYNSLVDRDEASSSFGNLHADRILLVDDDREFCELICRYLGNEGFELCTLHDGEKGLHEAETEGVSLVLLDVALPGMGGFEVLRRLRRVSDVPVLMLTARGEDVDRIVGLELGADDYLPKPFNPRELVARIRAILRRKVDGGGDSPETYRADELVLDRRSRTLYRGADEIPLTTVEFDLLRVLLAAAGRTVGREELSLSVLGRPFSPLDRSLDMHVSNLRRKLGHAPGGGERIKTVRSTGYLFVPSRTGSRSRF